MVVSPSNVQKYRVKISLGGVNQIYTLGMESPVFEYNFDNLVPGTKYKGTAAVGTATNAPASPNTLNWYWGANDTGKSDGELTAYGIAEPTDGGGSSLKLVSNNVAKGGTILYYQNYFALSDSRGIYNYSVKLKPSENINIFMSGVGRFGSSLSQWYMQQPGLGPIFRFNAAEKKISVFGYEKGYYQPGQWYNVECFFDYGGHDSKTDKYVISVSVWIGV